MALGPDDFIDMDGGFWIELVDGLDCFGREIIHWYWENEDDTNRAKGKDKVDVDVDKGKDKDGDKGDKGEGEGEGEDRGGESANKKQKIEG